MLNNKITRRWLRNSFGVIVAIILIIEIVSAVAIKRFYYNNAESTLRNKADIIANTLQQYSKDSSKDFDEQVSRYVTEFSDKSQMELMIIDVNGNTRVTSSGFMPEDKSMLDYQTATANSDRVGVVVGDMGAKQRVMMLSLLAPVEREYSISAVRLATSMENIDQQIFYIIVGLIAFGVLVLTLVLYTSYYFITGIVRPIGRVGETARLIAQGDFDARLEVRYDDEIGELADIINYMAGELGTTEQMKNEFMSSVSHELRTPLTAIQGWGETILLDKGSDKELLEKGMKVIIGETGRLSVMVEELLDFSRMQSGQLRLIKAPINPIIELEEAVLMYTPKAAREKITLDYDYNDYDIKVYGDKNRLRQVFINIIDNAVKYSDPGDVVDVMTQLSWDNLVIKVSDSGIGISAEDLPNITNRFYKADSTRRGSGIGLAVVKELISRHDGTLLVDSVKGVGTTITITLPIYRGNDNTVVEETLPDNGLISKESDKL